jgi:hypothetical protein
LDGNRCNLYLSTKLVLLYNRDDKNNKNDCGGEEGARVNNCINNNITIKIIYFKKINNERWHRRK